MVAPQKGISSEGLPGASQSREKSVVTAKEAQILQLCQLLRLQEPGEGFECGLVAGFGMRSLWSSADLSLLCPLEQCHGNFAPQ